MSTRITIKDIAVAIGVSVTTVYKALNGKPKVSEEIRQRIIAKAEELHYKPNKLAQGLARNKKTIGFLIPKYPDEFMRYVLEGIRDSMSDLMDYNIDGVIKIVANNSEHKKACKELIAVNVDGIIMVPNKIGLGLNIGKNRSTRTSIPVACIVSEPMDGTPCICVIRSDGRVLGRMAAQYMSLSIQKGKPVIIMVPDKETKIHIECVESFSKEVRERGLRMAGDFEIAFEPELAAQQIRSVIESIPGLSGIYVASCFASTVCKCIEDINRTDIQVVGHDLYPELAECLKRGSLQATLFQNQSKQVHDAISYMVKYLTESSDSFVLNYFRPELVMSSNLDCYKGIY